MNEEELKPITWADSLNDAGYYYGVTELHDYSIRPYPGEGFKLSIDGFTSYKFETVEDCKNAAWRHHVQIVRELFK